jgi:competence protein ComGF
MASFICALLLFILVLFNGCFTLPIDDEQKINFGSDSETNGVPLLTRDYPLDEHIGFTESTTVTAQSNNGKRYHDDLLLSSSEPTTYETEQSDNDKRVHDDLLLTSSSEPTTTIEQSDNDKRVHDDLLLSSSEPTTYETEQSDNDKHVHDDYLLTSSELTTTIEQSDNDKRVHDDYLLSTTVDSSTPIVEVERRVFKDDLENEIETVDGKREMPVQLLTNNTLSSTSTPISSTVAPKFSVSVSSTSTLTSTEKYIGLLKNENVTEEEEPIKPLKKIRRRPHLKLTPTTPVIQSKETEEDPHESSVPIAQFDQEASDKIPNVPVYNMILDENNTLVVTELPEKLSTTAMKNLNEEKQLNQGEESLHTEKKE